MVLERDGDRDVAHLVVDGRLGVIPRHLGPLRRIDGADPALLDVGKGVGHLGHGNDGHGLELLELHDVSNRQGYKNIGG